MYERCDKLNYEDVENYSTSVDELRCVPKFGHFLYSDTKITLEL